MSEHHRIYGILLARINPHYVNITDPMKAFLSYIYERLLSTPIANFSVLVKGSDEIMFDEYFRRFTVNYNAMRIEFSVLRIDMEAVYGTSLDNDVLGITYSDMYRLLVNGMPVNEFAHSIGKELDSTDDVEEIENALIYVITNGIPQHYILEDQSPVFSNGVKIEDTDFEFSLQDITPEKFSREAVKGGMLFYLACRFSEGVEHDDGAHVDVIVTGFDRKIDSESGLRCGTLIYLVGEVELKITVKFYLWSDYGFAPQELQIQVDNSVVYAATDILVKEGSYPGKPLMVCMKFDFYYLYTLSKCNE